MIPAQKCMAISPEKAFYQSETRSSYYQ